MNCLKCHTETKLTIKPYRYVGCGLLNVIIDKCKIYVCPSCHEEYAVPPNSRQTALTIAAIVVAQERRLNADEILFLRKTMGLRAEGLAQLIGVHRVEISRWENGWAKMDSHHEFRLRMHAIRALLPKEKQPTAVRTVAAMFGLSDVSKLRRPVKTIHLTPRQLQLAGQT